MYLSPGLLLMGCPRISSDLGFPSLVGCAVKMTVLSKKQATTYQPQGKAILIGITDFGGFPEEYAGTFVDVLRLQFDDIDHEMDPERFGVFKLFDSFQAGIVTSFVHRYVEEGEIDEIVVHCEAGVSRSAATAAAISLMLKQKEDEARFFKAPYVPNRHVYRLLLDGMEHFGLIG